MARSPEGLGRERLIPRSRPPTRVPTIISHPAVAFGLRRFFGCTPLSTSVVIAGAIGSILPDIDVAGFAFGIQYGSLFGHRGFTHSIFFALLVACISALLMRSDRRAFAFVLLCSMSHGLLDAMTDGGRGVAFFSPFSNHRYFLPWRPIEVSPIGHLDLGVLVSEIKWVWLPCGIAGLVGWLWMPRETI